MNNVPTLFVQVNEENSKGQGGCRQVMAWAFCARSFSLFLGHGCCRTRGTSWIQRASLGSHWKSSGIFSPKNKKDTTQKKRKKSFWIENDPPFPLFGKQSIKLIWFGGYEYLPISKWYSVCHYWLCFVFYLLLAHYFYDKKRAKNFLKKFTSSCSFPWQMRQVNPGDPRLPKNLFWPPSPKGLFIPSLTDL